MVKNMWFYGLSKKLYERLSDDEYVFFASGDFLGGSLKHTSKNCYKLCFLHRDKGAVTLSCYSKRSAAEQVSRLYGRVSV